MTSFARVAWKRTRCFGSSTRGWAMQYWKGVAKRLRPMVSGLVISATLLFVPFVLVVSRFMLVSEKEWQEHLQRNKADRHLKGWSKLRAVYSDEKRRRAGVATMWGRMCHVVVKRFRYGRGMPLDLAAWLRLMERHSRRYEEAREEALQAALNLQQLDALPSLTGSFASDMLCAMHHSRAAYCYATHTSLLATLTSWMFFQARQGARGKRFDKDVRSEIVLKIAQLSEGDIVEAEWNRAGIYNPCFYVAIDHAHQLIVVAIRGTSTIADLLTDAAAEAKPVVLGHNGKAGWMHGGILNAAVVVLPRVQRALAKAAERAPGWPVLLCGHSLGGGVAANLAVLLSLPHNHIDAPLGPMRCISFACPPVMCEELAPTCADLVTSVVVGVDAIPRFSHATLDSVIVEAAKLSHLRRATSLVGRGIDSLARSLLRRNGTQPTSNRQLNPVHLYPAGRLLWCVPAENGRYKEEFKDVRIAECKREWMCDMLMHIDVLNHHLSDTYLRAVEAVVAHGAANEVEN